jgi:hypothetical protein
MDALPPGETWQFVRLRHQTALLNRQRYYLDNVSVILGVLQAICQEAVTHNPP